MAEDTLPPNDGEEILMEQAVTEEQVKEATAMGWADKEHWRGRAEDWVDAATFLERGRTIMPMLQKNNEKLLGRVTQLESSLRASEATLKAITDVQAKDAVADREAEEAAIELEIAEASERGDHKALAAATVRLTKLQAQPLPGKDTMAGAAASTELHPDMVTWQGANPDFVSNPRKMALGTVIARELRLNGDVRVGAAFMDAVRDEVEKVLNPKAAPVNRVSGGNGGTGRSDTGGGVGKTYADLPADAKAACDKAASRLVGPGKAHKDMDSWRKSYVRQYFSM